MKINAGIFDVGNVLCTIELGNLEKEEEKIFYISENVISKKYKKIRNKVVDGEISEEEFWDIYLKNDFKNKIPSDDFLYKSYKKHFKKLPTIDIAKSLLDLNIKLSALANIIPSHAKVIRESHILDNFNEEVFSCEVGLRKPDLEIYELTLSKLDAKPRETFFVDDLEENVEAAKKVGINSILFRDEIQLKRDLKSLGLVI